MAIDVSAPGQAKHNVISYYPLTDGHQQKLAGSIEEPLDFIAIGRLRNLRPVALLRKIRALRADRMTVAIENENARAVAGPLMMVAALSGSRRVYVSWPDGELEYVPRAKIVAHLFRLAGAQVSGRLAVRRANTDLRRLEGWPAIAPKADMARRSVLYLDANLSFGIAAGGSVGHIRGVIDALARTGFDVDYASCKVRPTPLANYLSVPPPDLYGFPPEINSYTFNSIYQNFLAKAVLTRRYSFIYQRMSLHNFTGALMRQKLEVPLVLEFNGSEVWVAANWSEKLRMQDMAIKAEAASLLNADIVVAVSKVLGEQVAAAGVPRDRIVVYPNGIDPSIFDPARFSRADKQKLRDRYGIPSDATVATFIGTFGMWHGVDFLARAIRRLVEDEPDWLAQHKLHFLLVGDGLKMLEVSEILAPAPVAAHVTLTGLVPQAQAPGYLAASDIFLSPHVPNPDGTPFFGSPTKLFEYMAMHRPIVAADLDQIGAVLRGTYLGDAPSEGPMAALYTPGDEAAFIEALKVVVENPHASIAMADQARRAALEFYTWDKHVEAILDRIAARGENRLTQHASPR